MIRDDAEQGGPSFSLPDRLAGFPLDTLMLFLCLFLTYATFFPPDEEPSLPAWVIATLASAGLFSLYRFQLRRRLLAWLSLRITRSVVDVMALYSSTIPRPTYQLSIVTFWAAIGLAYFPLVRGTPLPLPMAAGAG